MNSFGWKLITGALVASAVAAAAITQVPSIHSPAVGAASNTSVQTSAGSLTTDSAQAMASMAGILDREVEERLRLEEEVTELKTRLASLEKRLSDSLPAAATADARQQVTGARGGGTRGEISENSFLSAGFDQEQATYYQRLYDESVMAQLYLRDRARQEGWLGGERYDQELAALPANLSTLRRQMDEETYARYLYALGRPNQVRIQRVLTGSQAEAAGLRDGDVLVRVDGQRIYAAGEVRRVSREPGESATVALEVLRNGRRIQTYLPRGPFGISMASDSILPDKTQAGP
jgi:hypothetical protein